MISGVRLGDHLDSQISGYRVPKFMKNKHVYSFNDGDGHDRKLLGGKGANLCEMTQIGINVPPGFVITTEACLDYLEQERLQQRLLTCKQSKLLSTRRMTAFTQSSHSGS